jgi:hypothetical protein
MENSEQVERALDEQRDTHEKTVLDALRAMFPEYDFDPCYDLSDLMNHAAGTLNQEREEQAKEIEQLQAALSEYDGLLPK